MTGAAKEQDRKIVSELRSKKGLSSEGVDMKAAKRQITDMTVGELRVTDAKRSDYGIVKRTNRKWKI